MTIGGFYGILGQGAAMAPQELRPYLHYTEQHELLSYAHRRHQEEQWALMMALSQHNSGGVNPWGPVGEQLKPTVPAKPGVDRRLLLLEGR